MKSRLVFFLGISPPDLFLRSQRHLAVVYEMIGVEQNVIFGVRHSKLQTLLT
jgi:hypothetical protein